MVSVVAQITPWKGQLEAIEAFALVHESRPDAHLLIAGEAKFVVERDALRQRGLRARAAPARG